MAYHDFYKDLLAQNGGNWFDFEGLIRDIYVDLLKPGDWAIDAGAHQGGHTVQMAQAVAPNGRVVAIEPVPMLVKTLRKTAKVHFPHFRKVIEYHCCGLSDSKRREVFYFAPDVAAQSGLRKRTVIASQRVEEFKIPVTTLDRMCAGASRPFRFLKIDIEGGEYHALRGAMRTIARDRPVIVFEHNATSPADFGYTMEQMRALWRELDYRVYDLFGNAYAESEAWNDLMVWDFLALPRLFPAPDRIFEVVRKTLAGAGIAYAARY